MKKIHSAFRPWILIYFLPALLFVLGTVIGQGDWLKKVEVYVVVLSVASLLTLISRYSTFISITEDGKITLSALFIKRNFKTSDILSANSKSYPVFGASMNSIEISLKNNKKTGIVPLFYNMEKLLEIKKYLNIQI